MRSSPWSFPLWAEAIVALSSEASLFSPRRGRLDDDDSASRLPCAALRCPVFPSLIASVSTVISFILHIPFVGICTPYLPPTHSPFSHPSPTHPFSQHPSRRCLCWLHGQGLHKNVRSPASASTTTPVLFPFFQRAHLTIVHFTSGAPFTLSAVLLDIVSHSQ